MAENSKIEWTHHTFNPVLGCQKVGKGCDNCYAEGWAKRSGLVKWGAGEARRVTSDAYWRQPLKWDREAAAAGERRRVFCASLADVFDNAWPPGIRERLFALIKATPRLDWLLLTKRPGNIAKMLPPDWGHGYPNVWIGCTVVNQEEADRDIPKLLSVPAVVRFLSMEPLLGPVDLLHLRRYNPRGEPWINALRGLVTRGQYLAKSPEECSFNTSTQVFPPELPSLDWVIVGGESGPGARVWDGFEAACRSLRDQCRSAGVAFFMKQMAGARKSAMLPIPDDLMIREFPRAAGRLLDGREWNQIPGGDAWLT